MTQTKVIPNLLVWSRICGFTWMCMDLMCL